MTEALAEPQQVDVNALLKLQPILLFDGQCAFCNKSVQFFLRNENKKKSMHFAPLDSEAGKALQAYFKINKKVDSIILIRQHDAYIKSCAALRLTLYMRGIWPLLVSLVVIPPFLRNLVYDFIAKNRQKIAGRLESCELLKTEDRERFLDK